MNVWCTYGWKHDFNQVLIIANHSRKKQWKEGWGHRSIHLHAKVMIHMLSRHRNKWTVCWMQKESLELIFTTCTQAHQNPITPSTSTPRTPMHPQSQATSSCIDLPPSSHMPLPLHLLSPLGEYTGLSPQIITPSMPFSQETLWRLPPLWSLSSLHLFKWSLPEIILVIR